MMNIVLDSNIIFQVAFTQKPPRLVWDKLLNGSYTLCVTEDKHFNELKAINFPKVNVITLLEFIEILNRG